MNTSCAKTADGRVVITIDGEMRDRENFEELENVLEWQIQARPAGIDIHLAKVPYVDSTGSAMLIVAYNMCRRAGVRVRFVEPSAHVKKIFEVTKLDTIFTIVE